MGIIDNLKEQADQDLSKQLDRELSAGNIQHVADVIISPVMTQIYLYLKEFAQHLNVIDQSVKISNYSKLFPELGDLQQANYKINTDGSGGTVSHDKIKEVHFSYKYQALAVKEYIHHSNNKLEADRIKDFLTSHKIAYTSTNNLASKNNGALNCYITNDFPVTFKFTAQPEKSTISLCIQNHENFENRNIIIKPGEVNDEYLDKLARYILRKDSEFLDIEIEDDVKTKIRQRIEAEKEAKQAEEAKLANESEGKEKPSSKSFFAKLFK